MKKILTIFSLAVLFSLTTQAFAAPPPMPYGDGHRVMTRYHHNMHYGYRPSHMYYGGHNSFHFYTNVPYYNHYWGCRCPNCIANRHYSGAGIYVRF